MHLFIALTILISLSLNFCFNAHLHLQFDLHFLHRVGCILEVLTLVVASEIGKLFQSAIQCAKSICKWVLANKF